MSTSLSSVAKCVCFRKVRLGTVEFNFRSLDSSLATLDPPTFRLMRAPLPDSLPKPTFRKVDDDLSRKPSAPVDALSRSFGCQFRPLSTLEQSPHPTFVDRDGEGFDRPAHYIRHTGTLVLETSQSSPLLSLSAQNHWIVIS